MQSSDNRRRQPHSQQQGGNSRSGKFCCLGRAANRPGYDGHFLSQCRYLPEADRKRFSPSNTRIRNVEAIELGEEDHDFEMNDYEDSFDASDRRDGNTNQNSLFTNTIYWFLFISQLGSLSYFLKTLNKSVGKRIHFIDLCSKIICA